MGTDTVRADERTRHLPAPLDMIISGYKWHTCLAYLYDVIVFSKNLGEQIDHVDAVLSALREAGVSLNLRKFQFFTDRIRNLGHIFRAGTPEVEEAATASLKELRHPTTPVELRSFLCIADSLRVLQRSQPHSRPY